MIVFSSLFFFFGGGGLGCFLLGIGCLGQGRVVIHGVAGVAKKIANASQSWTSIDTEHEKHDIDVH